MTVIVDCETRDELDDDTGRGEAPGSPSMPRRTQASSTDAAVTARVEPAAAKGEARRFADAVFTRTFLDHVGNVVGVTGICLVMAGVGLVVVQVMNVVSAQCIVDAQGACATMPDLSGPGLVSAGVGLAVVLCAAIIKKFVPHIL